MYPANVRVWEVWRKLSQFERPMGFGGVLPLTMTSMARFCEIYELDMGDFEMMLLLEEIMYPAIQKRAEEEAKLKEG